MVATVSPCRATYMAMPGGRAASKGLSVGLAIATMAGLANVTGKGATCAVTLGNPTRNSARVRQMLDITTVESKVKRCKRYLLRNLFSLACYRGGRIAASYVRPTSTG